MVVIGVNRVLPVLLSNAARERSATSSREATSARRSSGMSWDRQEYPFGPEGRVGSVLPDGMSGTVVRHRAA
jgi:hypothetical protein